MKLPNAMDLAAMEGELQKALDLFQYQKFLCIQPHPDDNEVGAGGTIAKLAAQGAEIHYLTMTDGSVGTLNPNLSAEELAAMRKAEVMAAGQRLGVQQYHWLEQPDGALIDSPTVRAALCQVIRSVRPDVILTVDPWLPYEAHLDHVTTGRLVAHVALSSGFPHVFPEQVQNGLAPHAPKALAFYATHAPNTTVDIDAFLPLKLTALADHHSQFAGESLAFLQAYLTGKAMQAAAGQDFQYGEALKVLTPMMLHMNVDAYLM